MDLLALREMAFTVEKKSVQGILKTGRKFVGYVFFRTFAIILTKLLAMVCVHSMLTMKDEKTNRQEAILRAAEAEFLTKGYAGAKTVAIARRAGVTHAMLHYYYGTKERLFHEVFEAKLQLMGHALLQAFMKSHLPFMQRIEEGLRSHFDFLAANPGLPGFLLHEISAADSERMNRVRQPMFRLMQTVVGHLQPEVDELVRKGEIAPITCEDLIIDMVSLNVFYFVAGSLIDPFFVADSTQRAAFLERRKEENVRVIRQRLKLKS